MLRSMRSCKNKVKKYIFFLISKQELTLKWFLVRKVRINMFISNGSYVKSILIFSYFNVLIHYVFYVLLCIMYVNNTKIFWNT